MQWLVFFSAALLATGAMGIADTCNLHQDCPMNQYCADDNLCYPCAEQSNDDCCFFNDAVDQTCPDKCNGPCTTAQPSPTPAPCQTHDDCADDEYCVVRLVLGNQCHKCAESSQDDCCAFGDGVGGPDKCPDKCAGPCPQTTVPPTKKVDTTPQRATDPPKTTTPGKPCTGHDECGDGYCAGAVGQSYCFPCQSQTSENECCDFMDSVTGTCDRTACGSCPTPTKQAPQTTSVSASAKPQPCQKHGECPDLHYCSVDPNGNGRCTPCSDELIPDTCCFYRDSIDGHCDTCMSNCLTTKPVDPTTAKPACNSHEQCQDQGDQYCGTDASGTNVCYDCADCCTFLDAFDGACPDYCGPCPTTTKKATSTTTVPDTCSGHADCAQGYCAVDALGNGMCRPCAQATNNDCCAFHDSIDMGCDVCGPCQPPTTTAPPTTTTTVPPTTTTTVPPTTTTVPPTTTTTSCEISDCKTYGATGCTCTQCTNGMYLTPDGSACVPADQCPGNSFPWNIFSATQTNDGLCVEPGFVCTPGTNCRQCPRSVVNAQCTQCQVNSADDIKCLKCDGRLLLSGKCYASALCTGSSYRDAPDEPCSCRGLNGNNGCGDCMVFPDGSKECRTCKGGAGWYKRDYDQTEAVCVQAADCPEGTLPWLKSGRDAMCRPPFTCTAGSASIGPNGCVCAQSQCRTCDFTLADPQNPTCTECQARKFLSDGSCVDTCPADKTHYGTAKRGRECRDEFVCDHGFELDAAGNPTNEACKCTAKRCVQCSYDANNAPRTSRCVECSKYLVEANAEESTACPRRCSGTVSTNSDGVKVCTL